MISSEQSERVVKILQVGDLCCIKGKNSVLSLDDKEKGGGDNPTAFFTSDMFC